MAEIDPDWDPELAVLSEKEYKAAKATAKPSSSSSSGKKAAPAASSSSSSSAKRAVAPSPPSYSSSARKTAVAAPSSSSSTQAAAAASSSSTKKRNAFAELMSPKGKSAKPAAAVSQPSSRPAANNESETTQTKGKLATKKPGNWRGALLEYIEHPERFSDAVLRVTPNTVLIKDAFPKAMVHLLLLPRSKAHYELHPHEAFEDPEFLVMMKREADSAVHLAAAELRRQISSFSETDKARNEAIDAGVPVDELPAGRNYCKEIRVGVHAHPSMDHLHVHIISSDMVSDRMKHRKHYNSMNTPFFIPLLAYPLAEDDKRRQTWYQNANLQSDLVCMRCRKNFGNKFADLKQHLEIERDLWVEE
ncbi:HIT-like domain-containing protein [Apodospora peruviana]|uniref:Aprataxin-like protein n=1 Tax=Apodospora peruviana TaxID=516989 RepID=A0AAE0M571_9PEZI|nr:HIT-like domain-containing protein [Apodospora peruviana]